MKISTRKLLFVMVILSLPALAQQNYLSNRYMMERINSNQDLLTGTTGMFNKITTAAPGVVGDAFLNNSFSESTFLMFEGDKIVGGYRAKYDILRDDFYLLHQNIVRVLDGGVVRNFLLVDSLTRAKTFFINGSLLKDDTGAQLSGFYEVVVDGPVALLKKTNAVVKAADFHPALNVGSKDHRVIKTVAYFYSNNDVVSKIPSAKNISKMFPQQTEEMTKFLKVNGLSLKEERDLKNLFEHYTGLVK
ncbi:MAG: hypothetical protein ACO3FI_05835 [Cyclobacteriaceae bacterium]